MTITRENDKIYTLQKLYMHTLCIVTYFPMTKFMKIYWQVYFEKIFVKHMWVFEKVIITSGTCKCGHLKSKDDPLT